MSRRKKDKKYQARKTRPASLGLTSLMDVLTIILLFLLVNYSDSVVEVEIPENVALPSVNSKSSNLDTDGLVVGVSADGYQVGETLIQNANAIRQLTILLKKKKEEGVSKVLVKADQDIEYNKIDLVILSATRAGISSLDFIALSEE